LAAVALGRPRARTQGSYYNYTIIQIIAELYYNYTIMLGGAKSELYYNYTCASPPPPWAAWAGGKPKCSIFFIMYCYKLPSSYKLPLANSCMLSQ
jgi:hypothetical protein